MKKPESVAGEIMKKVGDQAIKSHALQVKLARIKSLAKAGLATTGAAVEWREALERIVQEVER